MNVTDRYPLAHSHSVKVKRWSSLYTGGKRTTPYSAHPSKTYKGIQRNIDYDDFSQPPRFGSRCALPHDTIHVNTSSSERNGMLLSSSSTLDLIDFLRRALTNVEKKAYIDAVRCSQSPQTLNISRPAWTRFNEFQAHHFEIACDIHFMVSLPRIFVVGVFLKYSKGIRSGAARTQCGYDGAHLVSLP